MCAYPCGQIPTKQELSGKMLYLIIPIHEISLKNISNYYYIVQSALFEKNIIPHTLDDHCQFNKKLKLKMWTRMK